MRLKPHKRDARKRPVFEAPTRRPGSMGGPRREGANWLRNFWHSPKWLTRAAQALRGVAFLLALFMAASLALRMPILEFRQVSVTGEVRHMQHAELQQLVRVWRGNFLTLDLDQVRRDVAALPWVKDAAVARRWPAELVIEVSEHQPLARWGRRSLVDVDGVVFAAQVGDELPQFSGPDEHAARVVEHYHKLKLALAPIGLKPVELRISPRLAWEAKLDNGFKLELGRNDFDERTRTFLTAYRVELHNHVASELVVDLRYKHGLALKAAQLPERATQPGRAVPDKPGKTKDAKKRA